MSVARIAPPVSRSMATAVSSDALPPLQIFDRAPCVMPTRAANSACVMPLASRWDASLFSMPANMPDRNMHVKHEYSQSAVEWLTRRDHNGGMKNVRTLRLARGLTQAQLAELAGVNQATISKAERGEMNTTMETIVAIANALRVEPVELFDLPELQARALAAISAIDPEQRAAALVVLEAMAKT